MLVISRVNCKKNQSKKSSLLIIVCFKTANRKIFLGFGQYKFKSSTGFCCVMHTSHWFAKTSHTSAHVNNLDKLALEESYLGPVPSSTTAKETHKLCDY